MSNTLVSGRLASRQHTANNALLAGRIKRESKINYCRYLSKKQFAHFSQQYEFSGPAMDELQAFLNVQFKQIPYGWDIPMMDSGITNIFESFIATRRVPKKSIEHISI